MPILGTTTGTKIDWKFLSRAERLNCRTHIVESSRSVDVQHKERDNAVNNLILTVSLSLTLSLLCLVKRSISILTCDPEASYRCSVPAQPIHSVEQILYENRNRWILIKGTKPNHSGFAAFIYACFAKAAVCYLCCSRLILSSDSLLRLLLF